jgi:hypothetical protein
MFILCSCLLNNHKSYDYSDDFIQLSLIYNLQGENKWADSLLVETIDSSVNVVPWNLISTSDLVSRLLPESLMFETRPTALELVNATVVSIFKQANIKIIKPNDFDDRSAFANLNYINPQLYTLFGTETTKKNFEVNRYRNEFNDFDRLINGIFINQANTANLEYMKIESNRPSESLKADANLHVNIIGSIRLKTNYKGKGRVPVTYSSTHGIYATEKWRDSNFEGKKVRVNRILKKRFPNYGKYVIVVGDRRLDNEELGLAISHEIGHALGLLHSEEEGNLMNSSMSMMGTHLTNTQIENVRSGAKHIKNKDVVSTENPVCRLVD